MKTEKSYEEWSVLYQGKFPAPRPPKVLESEGDPIIVSDLALATANLRLYGLYSVTSEIGEDVRAWLARMAGLAVLHGRQADRETDVRWTWGGCRWFVATTPEGLVLKNVLPRRSDPAEVLIIMRACLHNIGEDRK